MDDFVVHAVLGGAGIAVVAGPLGCFVVWRRMAYFGDALGHSALLGVVLGVLLHIVPALGVVVVALAMAMSLGLGLRGRTIGSDTLLGILAHGALAAGLVAATFLPTLRIDLLGYLFGDILSLSTADVIGIWIGAAVILGLLAWLWAPLLAITVHEELARVEGVRVDAARLGLMLVMALVVAVALKVVGIILVTALLIVPAAAARRFAATPEQMAAVAAAVGCVSVAAGLGGSLAWNTPSGPSIVLASVLIFAASAATSPLRLRRRRSAA